MHCDFCVVAAAVAVAVAVVAVVAVVVAEAVAVALMQTFPDKSRAKFAIVALQVAREGRVGGFFPIKPLRGATFDFT